MKKYEVVKKNEDFNDIINTGKFLKSYYYNIYYKVSNDNFPKFGIAVSKKYGNAVERNKIKRQIRSIVDHNKNLFSNYRNYIIMIKKGVKVINYSQMEQEFIHLLKKGNINEKD